jgi:hypothetical protein
MIPADSVSTHGFRVPDDLVERDQWVLWRFEAWQGKRTKVPFQANGRPASSSDPSTICAMVGLSLVRQRYSTVRSEVGRCWRCWPPGVKAQH